MNCINIHVPVAPFNPADITKPGFGRLGLARGIEDAESYARHVRDYVYNSCVVSNDLYNMGCRVHLQLPYGRWSPVRALGSGGLVWTGMRLDARGLCLDSAFHWVADAVDSITSVNPTRWIKYIGGNPALSMMIAGEDAFLKAGGRVVCDYAAKPKGSYLLGDLERRFKDGQDVQIEANHSQHSLPCLAEHGLWGRRNRHSMDSAPFGSTVWFSRGVRNDEEMGRLSRALASGLEVTVNLPPTKPAYRRAIRELAKAYA